MMYLEGAQSQQVYSRSLLCESIFLSDFRNTVIPARLQWGSGQISDGPPTKTFEADNLENSQHRYWSPADDHK